MEYNAEYTILIDGATWGRKDISFYADDDEQAKIIALEKENEYSNQKEELLLDYIFDEDGEEVNWER